MISLGGVIQNPGVDYTVSTNTITFTTNPASGLDFFGVLLGDAINTGTPSDGTVTTAKLASDLSVDLASGSAGTPSLTFDANSGLFSPANDEISISTNGGERFRVGSAGQFGIGGATYGSSGQVLTSQGSGSAPQWADASAVNVARITDSKTLGTNGGTFTNGAWRTRDLNAIEDDPDSIVTLSSNQFTLGAGTYLIQWSAPSFKVEFNQSRLYNITGSNVSALGTSEYSANTNDVQTRSFGFDIVTLTASNAFEIQHQCHTSVPTNGLGVRGNHAAEKYTMVTIFKLS